MAQAAKSETGSDGQWGEREKRGARGRRAAGKQGRDGSSKVLSSGVAEGVRERACCVHAVPMRVRGAGCADTCAERALCRVPQRPTTTCARSTPLAPLLPSRARARNHSWRRAWAVCTCGQGCAANQPRRRRGDRWSNASNLPPRSQPRLRPTTCRLRLSHLGRFCCRLDSWLQYSAVCSAARGLKMQDPGCRCTLLHGLLSRLLSLSWIFNTKSSLD